MKSSLLSCSPIFYLWLILRLKLEETRAREPACRGALGGENTGDAPPREYSTPHLAVRMPGLQMRASAPSLCGLWRAKLRSSYLTGKCHLTVSTAKTSSHRNNSKKEVPWDSPNYFSYYNASHHIQRKKFIGLAVYICRPDPCKFDVCLSILKA